MAETIPTSTFRDLGNDIDNALSVLADYGLEYSAGRFNQARRDLDELARLHEAGALAEAARDRTSSRLLASLFDMNDVSHICRSLQFLKGHGLDSEVRSFVAHPGDTIINERGDGEDGHDLAFELSMLSRFVASGFPVKIEESGDLRIEIAGRTVFVRCLRLRTPSQTGTRIRDASRALESCCSDVEGSRSVLALSVSKLAGLELNVLSAPDETRLYRMLNAPVQTFIQRNQHMWRHAPTPAMAGVFVFFARPVLISLIERLVYAQELTFSTAHGHSERDPAVLDVMLDRFDFLNALTSFT
ncbi:MAG: hypothetical protein ACI8TX_002016 [Hyphomicrobiaceae bacterium]|jgi:hypothetical protein